MFCVVMVAMLATDFVSGAAVNRTDANSRTAESHIFNPVSASRDQNVKNNGKSQEDLVREILGNTDLGSLFNPKPPSWYKPEVLKPPEPDVNSTVTSDGKSVNGSKNGTDDRFLTLEMLKQIHSKSINPTGAPSIPRNIVQMDDRNLPVVPQTPSGISFLSLTTNTDTPNSPDEDDDSEYLINTVGPISDGNHGHNTNGHHQMHTPINRPHNNKDDSKGGAYISKSNSLLIGFALIIAGLKHL